MKDHDSVLLPWVMVLPWKMQSILLSGLRAPDFKTSATKKICRWMRAISQNNADPSKGYMEPQDFFKSDSRSPNGKPLVIAECMDELEYLPCHYVHHFADALRVIGVYHNDMRIRAFANTVHEEIAEEIFHFQAEIPADFVARHKDRRETTNAR